ncbi:MAG: DUF4010 domain-containing protein [Nanoarchaeota archaeon]|nr:DUF4010 domain-containing protein [Nanoarchaeota archaeon]MBU1643828.1 DUF4010 domain-containing protein [Nanoarchaeota archaeon]MBU1976680.1 DUF4010 domain-containing protein [Nanoarchaeota archaeon]
MAELQLFVNFLIALALGGLIGLEREYARYRKRGHDYAGIRTFPLIALFGALSAYLGDIFNHWILLMGIILIGILILISYFSVSYKQNKYIGATSEVAGFLTFFIGVLAYFNELKLAVTLTVVITTILYSRSVLHHFAEHIKKEEMSDTLKFAIIAFIILPFLPNKGYGPYEIFNPFIIWLMVVFVSGISFIGYILKKWFGEKGIEMAGILGGLISSTATTTSFAERSKKEVNIFKALALGVILANGVMFVRIAVIVLILNKNLFVKILLPILILVVITTIFSYILWRIAKDVEGKIHLTSPFTLKPALKFGIFFAIILALVKLADVYLSSKGVYIVSFISGFADVDAITISLSQLAKIDLAENIARNGIIIAALTNVAVKGGIAFFFGGRKFWKIIVSFYAFLIAIGVLTIILL